MGVFAELANTNLADIKPPVLVPAGHYQAVITGPFTEHVAKSKNTAARFPFQLIAPGEDVDAAELEAAGGLPEKKYNLDFWMTPDSMFRFKNFAEMLGVAESANLMEALEEVGTSGQPFLIEAKHEPDSTDPTKVYLRFDNPTAIS